MRLIIATIVATLSLTACTPEQLNIYEQITGDRLDPALVDLPDVPLRLPDGREILPDGTVTPVPIAPSGSRCPQHYVAALRAGWQPTDWDKLDYIMWRESRCNPRVHNPVGRDDSYGLMQINLKAHRSWVRPIVNGDWTRLYDPETNLSVARELYRKAQGYYGCGWQPWRTTKQRAWCN